ncbi:P-II family nitrogen regulator [Allochromatium vinosum]|uniref:Nitrogen regulatory protein P-II n=1 Tax=Allochromatium vinosum (strain ATCC 17899 / DSM 180 / NBRC 103801 / NCIMB 10441 / D) TaxID=572477 RepID=D3RSS3_ALLVD|nr:P-II family nitrogen regulator [Allochromatium vinosum]ADC62232.1 nitrogen regulatory protein P-II [Allochromatium vinosum DSM 180]MBK1653549.1 transcriptional regulator [Allochromatium vinosum]
MKDDKITYLTDVVLITCIVEAGRGDAVIQAAQAMGAAGALVYHARGIGPRERLGLLGIAIEAEKDVVSLLVASDYQEVVFEAVYRAADLDRPGAGLAYITPVERLATYIPREVLAQVSGQESGQ